MTIETTDIRSNPNEQIAYAATVIGRSEARRKVFEEIHRGKKRVKTVGDIAKKTGLDRIKVLKAARHLYNNRIVKQLKVNGELAYEKGDFYAQNKKTILRLAGDKRALAKYPTKRNPRAATVFINLPVRRKSIDVKQLSIDDIDSFEKVTPIPLAPDVRGVPLLENEFQKGLQKILGEQGEFKDWGGENDDLFSTRLILDGKRMNVAFGLKGRGTRGKLTPKKMGKQGDQIQRLFRTPADVFLVQYWNQINQSVLEQMRLFAIAKSVLNGKRIYYGVIDGQDTLRMIRAYKECFEQETS
jgi:hypothetical protein